MAQEGFCYIHGPYDARLGKCPYCSSETPGAWQPESGDEPTRVYVGRPYEDLGSGDAPTEIGPIRKASIDFDEETLIRRRPGKGIPDEVEETILEHPVETLMGFLIIKRGGRRGKIFTLTGETTIGRKNAHIILNDPKVSELHAKIGIRGDHFVIVDVLSKNGTFVNGEKIQGERVLQENDEIRIGDTVMVLKVLPAESNQ